MYLFNSNDLRSGNIYRIISALVEQLDFELDDLRACDVACQVGDALNFDRVCVVCPIAIGICFLYGSLYVKVSKA
jgi:hypothetical protein